MNYWLSIILACIVVPASAQTSIVVMDKTNTAPIPNCRVEITSVSSQEKEVFGTDSSGSVSTSLKGKSYVRVSSFGYHSFEDTLELNQTIKIYLIQDKKSLEGMVVTGQYGPSDPEKSVHTVRVITKERMDAMGAVTLRDALTNETNMRLSQDGVLGSSVSIQGISGENVKILIDGVPIIGRLDGSIDLTQINLSDIERIEIVEGPMAVNYGTSALGGTINLITKKSQKRSWELSGNSFYESVGQYNWDTRIGWQKKKHQISFSGGRNYFDGWKEGDAIEVIPQEKLADTNRYKTWNPKEQYFAQVRYQAKIGRQIISPYFTWFDETVFNRGFPRKPHYESAFDDEYRTERVNIGFQTNGELGEYHYLEIIGAKNAFTRHKNTWTKDLTTLDQVLTKNAGDQDTSKFNLYMSRGVLSRTKDSTWINYQIGYDVNYESAYGERIRDKEQYLGDFALFGSTEISIDSNRFVLKPALRITYNTDYKAPLIPSFHLKYGQDKWTFRASYAQGFRAPSLKELYFLFKDINHDIIGNPDLTAEKSHNVQLNVKWKKGLKKGGLNIRITGFYNQIFNRITLGLTSTQGQYQYFNIAEYISRGVQTDVSLNKEAWNINVGGTYNGIYNSISDLRDEVDRFSHSPEIRVNGTYRIKKIKTSISLFYKYTGRVVSFTIDENDNVRTGTLEDYHTLDVSASKKFWKDRLIWTIGGKNLFNVTGVTTSSVNQGAHSGNSSTTLTAWGTSVFTSLKFNLNL